MSAVHDLVLRRAARAPDVGELVRQIGNGLESIFAQVSDWPLSLSFGRRTL